jgi:DME family drug/metabolite transporter
MAFTKSNLGLAAAAAAATLWAISGVFAKILMMRAVSPSQLVFYRSAIGSAVVAAALLLKNRTLLKVSWRDLPFLIGLGVLGLALTQFFYYAAIQSMSVGLAILLQYLAPLWILLFERFQLKRPLTRPKILAVLLAFLGCLLVSVPVAGSPLVSMRGVFFGIAAGICFAAYALMSQKALRSYSPITLLLYSLSFSMIFWGILTSGLEASWRTVNHFQLGLILYVAVLGTLVPFLLFIFALKHLEASQVAIISTLEPVMAAVIAWIHLGEGLTSLQMIGGVFVLTAITILQVRNAERPQGTETTSQPV